MASDAIDVPQPHAAPLTAVASDPPSTAPREGTGPPDAEVLLPELLRRDLGRVRAMCDRLVRVSVETRLLLEETYARCVVLAARVTLLDRRVNEAQALSWSARNPGPDDLEQRPAGAASRDGPNAAALAAARLDGAILVARTAAHLINNDLTTAIGLGELIRRRLLAGQPVELALVDGAVDGARRAARHLRELQGIRRLDVDDVYPGDLAVLNLARSTSRGETESQQGRGQP